MLSRRKAFETRAITSWMPFIANSHGGSSMKTALVTSELGRMCCRQFFTKAHILKAEATGPSVPAIMGNAAEANHQRLLCVYIVSDEWEIYV